MKIAIITSGILPIPAVQGGAVENLIDYYLEYNERHNLHDITIYSVWHPDVSQHQALEAKSNHYEYINIHNKWFRLCAKINWILHRDSYYFYLLEYFFEKTIKKVTQKKFDLIILENRPIVAAKLSQKSKTPIVSHIHTNSVNPDTRKKEDILRTTNKFLVVSNFIKKQIESIGINTNVEVVYNGLDAQRFNKKNITPIPRDQFGFKNGDFVAIYSGRIVPQKGVKELLQAFQLLKDYPDIKLLVVGGDNFGDSVKANAFLDNIHEMAENMDGKVKFTGFVPYKQLPAYLCMANVAVVPSRINDALPTACIEATAVGLPIIATNDGGIPETLVGQKHILLDKDDNLPVQIAKAVLEIKNNYEKFLGNSLNNIFKKEVYAESFFKAIEL